MIAAVVWNRIFSKDLKFNPVEKIFMDIVEILNFLTFLKEKH